MDNTYLVDTEKCKIRNVDPYNSDVLKHFTPEHYLPCSLNPLLSYTKRIGDIFELHINNSLMKIYTNWGVACCFSEIGTNRRSDKKPKAPNKYKIENINKVENINKIKNINEIENINKMENINKIENINKTTSITNKNRLIKSKILPDRKNYSEHPSKFINSNPKVCNDFVNSSVVKSQIISVQCWRKLMIKKLTTVYQNVHFLPINSETVRIKSNVNPKSMKPLSLLIIGIDSISRLNFIRSFPETRKYLVRNKWIEMKGYNRVSRSSLSNMMAILAGKNESEFMKACKEYKICNLLWDDFR